MSALLAAALAALPSLIEALAGCLVFAGFVRLYRRERDADVVLALWLLVVVDAVLYHDSAAETRRSVFHLNIAGQNVRLVEVVILLAVAAFFTVRGVPRRMAVSSLLWGAFFAWYGIETVVGVLAHHGLQTVLGEAVAILYIGGPLLLAEQMPPDEHLRVLRRVVRIVAVIAVVNFTMDQAKISINAAIPLLPFDDVGPLGADATSIYVAVGCLGLCVEAVNRNRSRVGLGASLVLIVSELASTQRAALVALVTTLLLLVLSLAWPVVRRRVRVLPVEAALALVAVAGLVLLPVFVRAVAQSSHAAALPFSSATAKAVDTSRRQGSVQSRFNQYAVVEQLVAEQPVQGYGLGKQFVHYEVGLSSFIVQDISHDIALDILLRSGAVGLLLFAAGTVASLGTAGSEVRRQRDDRLAALCLGAGAVVVGMLAKGAVESILDKYRLALVLGLLLGTISSVRLASTPRDVADDRIVEATRGVEVAWR